MVPLVPLGELRGSHREAAARTGSSTSPLDEAVPSSEMRFVIVPRIDVWQIEIPQPLSPSSSGAQNDRASRLTSRRDVRLGAWMVARMVAGRILGCSPDELCVERTCLICGDHFPR